MNAYRLGRISFGIEGTGLVAAAVAAEAGSLPSFAGEPKVAFRFGETRSGIPCMEGREGQEVRKVISGMAVSYLRDGDRAVVDVITHARRSRSVRPYYEAMRLRNWNYLYPHENVAKNFWYNVFDWTTQVAGLPAGQSWIHASGVAKNSACVAFLAKGGVGKTTAMLKLCLEDGWSYLSDDLAVVDDKGNLYRGPKRLQVYDYNADGQPAILEALMRGRSLSDRLAWSWRKWRHGPKGVRRRVSAEDLFGAGNVVDEAIGTSFVFLERSESSGCRLSVTTPSVLAGRMAPIIMQEIEPYSKVAMASLGLLSLPSIVEHQTREVIEAAFSRANCLLLSIGNDVSPDSLLDFIRREVVGP